MFYSWHTSRAAECLDAIVPVDFKGTIQCDGNSGYRAFASSRKGTIILTGCWAHARRGFYEVQTPRVSGWILRQIQNLYRIESVLRDKQAGPALRQACGRIRADRLCRDLSGRCEPERRCQA